MDGTSRSNLDWIVGVTGFLSLTVGVGAVTGRPLLAAGTAFLLLLALALVYPFARFAGEDDRT